MVRSVPAIALVFAGILRRKGGEWLWLFAGVSLLNPSLGHNRARAGRLVRPPRFSGPKYRGDFPVRESFLWKNRHCPPLFSGVPTDENPVDVLALRSEVFDIGVARDGASQGLPVGNDHCWTFDDWARPTEFLCSADLNAAGGEGDAVGRRLLGLKDDMTANLMDFQVFPALAEMLDQCFSAQVAWESHATASTSSRVR